jgi:Tfp pilus assembly protein PilE
LKLNWRLGTVSKQDMTRKTSRMGGWTVTEVLIVVAVLGAIAAVVMWPKNYVGDGRRSPANACIVNLRFIDSAKERWYNELHKQLTDIPTANDLQPYLSLAPGQKEGELPFCPSDPKHTFDTSYSINNVQTKPACKINPARHSLP